MRTSRRLWPLTLFLLGVIVGWMWSSGERVVVNHDLRPAVQGLDWNLVDPGTRALTVQPVTPSPPVMPPRPGAGRPHLGQMRFQAPPVDIPQ